VLHRTMVALSITLSALTSSTASPADSGRGRALYELRCVACHSESVHSRDKRVATNYDEIRHWVTRWNAELGAHWNKEEIEDVTAYLNERFYSYPCPSQQC
jgi:mono/diheme cytochrome c family protein